MNSESQKDEAIRLLLAAAEAAFYLIKESGFQSGLVEEVFDGTLDLLDSAICKAKGVPLNHTPTVAEAAIRAARGKW